MSFLPFFLTVFRRDHNQNFWMEQHKKMEESIYGAENANFIWDKKAIFFKGPLVNFNLDTLFSILTNNKYRCPFLSCVKIKPCVHLWNSYFEVMSQTIGPCVFILPVCI